MAMMEPGMADGVDPEWLHQVYTGGNTGRVFAIGVWMASKNVKNNTQPRGGGTCFVESKSKQPVQCSLCWSTRHAIPVPAFLSPERARAVSGGSIER